uniref:Uncharacterized protein n=1 Tax=Cacopsylla melanoneura TaxID=428564 RepID=A0A8D8LGY9_9HEMI
MVLLLESFFILSVFYLYIYLFYYSFPFSSHIHSLHLLMIHGKSVRFFRQRIPCEWFCCAHGNCNQLPLIPGFVVLHGNCNQFPLIPLGLNCYERKCVAPVYKTSCVFF